MGCFVYLVFGSSKDVTVGPTAIMALLSQHHVRMLGADLAVSESFLSPLLRYYENFDYFFPSHGV